MHFYCRRLALCAALALVSIAPCLRAQTTRTWNGSVDANWAVANNWTSPGVPGSGDTALFNGASSIPTINLGNATQPIRNIQFDGAVQPYILGVTATNDKFLFDNGGTIS